MYSMYNFILIVIFMSLHVPAGTCIQMLVCLQFMYLQYLSIVVCTNTPLLAPPPPFFWNHLLTQRDFHLGYKRAALT